MYSAIQRVLLLFLLPLAAARAQDIALPARGSAPFPLNEPTLAAGELLAQDLRFESLDAVLPTCPESTVAAMAADDADARAMKQRAPWGTKGRPDEIWKEWEEEIRMSCRVAAANKLIATSRAWGERPSPPWRAVWQAVLVPIGDAPYWRQRRSGTTTNYCEDPLERPAPCVTEDSSWHNGVPEHERNRLALQIAADLGLDDAQAGMLNAFAIDVVLRGGAHHRQLVGELFCDRLPFLETPAAMGRALDLAEALRQDEEAELFRAISQYFDEETVDKLHRYAMEQQPVLREVDHEAWFGKLSPEVAGYLADVRCKLGVPGRTILEESSRENGGRLMRAPRTDDAERRSRNSRESRDSRRSR